MVFIPFKLWKSFDWFIYFLFFFNFFFCQGAVSENEETPRWILFAFFFCKLLTIGLSSFRVVSYEGSSELVSLLVGRLTSKGTPAHVTLKHAQWFRNKLGDEWWRVIGVVSRHRITDNLAMSSFGDREPKLPLQTQLYSWTRELVFMVSSQVGVL